MGATLSGFTIIGAILYRAGKVSHKRVFIWPSLLLSALGVIQLPVGMYYPRGVGEAIVLLAGWSVLLFVTTLVLDRE